MKRTVNWPSCNHEIAIIDSDVGHELHCPHCHSRLAIPTRRHYDEAFKADIAEKHFVWLTLTFLLLSCVGFFLFRGDVLAGLMLGFATLPLVHPILRWWTTRRAAAYWRGEFPPVLLKTSDAQTCGACGITLRDGTSQCHWCGWTVPQATASTGENV